jgi:hypothetical protein
VFAGYLLAKVFEHYDRQIFELTGMVSGHTLKHVAAGLAGLPVAYMLWRRRLVSPAAAAVNSTRGPARLATREPWPPMQPVNDSAAGPNSKPTVAGNAAVLWQLSTHEKATAVNGGRRSNPRPVAEIRPPTHLHSGTTNEKLISEKPQHPAARARKTAGRRPGQ